MKRILIFMVLGLLLSLSPAKSHAQADEIAQLLLNVEKLSQLKSILSDMKSGYDIISTGYGTIKNISEGNFNMHELFLDNLLKVSPEVRRYYKIGGIVSYQLKLVRDYKSALSRYRSSGCFQPREITYIEGVFERLLSESLRNLDDLTNVITASKLRMSDNERIQEIDRIYAEMEDKSLFLKDFNGSTDLLALRRKKALAEIEGVRKLTGVK